MPPFTPLVAFPPRVAADRNWGYPLYDQRGSLRFDDGNGDALVGLDIGAFELTADEYFEGLGA